MNRNPLSQSNQASNLGSQQVRSAGYTFHCSRLLTDNCRGTVEILRGSNGRLRSVSTNVIQSLASR